jgi:hypothetical protein
MDVCDDAGDGRGTAGERWGAEKVEITTRNGDDPGTKVWVRKDIREDDLVRDIA